MHFPPYGGRGPVRKQRTAEPSLLYSPTLSPRRISGGKSCYGILVGNSAQGVLFKNSCRKSVLGILFRNPVWEFRPGITAVDFKFLKPKY